MSKRKPALRIGGGVLNRNTLISDADSVSSANQNSNGLGQVKASAGANDLDAEVANFLKEIDKVAASDTVNPAAEEQPKPAKFGNWQQCIDEKTQHPYYWNTVTDEVTWVLPEEVSKNSTYQNLAEEDAMQEEKESPAPQAKVVDLHSPMSAELDIDAELERAVVKKEIKTTKTIVTQASEVVKLGIESPKPVKKKIKESVKSSDDVDAPQHEKIPSENGDQTSNKSDTETEAKLTEISQTLFSKLQFLGISSAALTSFHYLMIQIETRLSDWREKALSPSFVLKKLQEADQQLKAYEESATPLGWSCHWDCSVKRYFYVNDKTNEKQWQYPEVSSGSKECSAVISTNKSDDVDVPVKKSRKLDPHPSSPPPPSGEPMPPLPATPQEKPPLPPQPPEESKEIEGEGDSDNPDIDDGIMMEISDEENEAGDGKKSKRHAAAAIMSQQPVLYKGPEGSSRGSSPLSYQRSNEAAPLQSQASISTKSNRITVNEKVPTMKTKRKKKSSSVVKKPAKGITSLVAQWQKAKNEIELEDRLLEEEEEEPDREELTQQQIERWKQNQIMSGKASSNANFEPVPDDWRSRLLQKKKKV